MKQRRSDQVTIVAGGDLDKKLLPEIRASDFSIGVDFGAAWLLANSIVPDMAIGDFDSVSAAQLGDIEKKVAVVKKYPAHKNSTDTELAVRYAVKLQPQEIIIYGGIGSRIDHTLGAIGLLGYIARKEIKCVMRGSKYQIELLGVGTHKVEQNKNLRYVSLISVSATAQVELQGFAYDGTHLLKRTQTKGLSNELHKSVGTITVSRGKFLLIHFHQ